MRGRAVVVALSMLVSLLLPGLAHAADGDLDTSFGGTGIVTTPFVNPSGGNGRGGLALLPGGKILVAVIDASGLQFARYESTGTLDTSFGTAGVKTVAASSGYLDEIAITSQGNIVALASGVLAQYDANGDPDTGFGTGGVVTLPACGGAIYDSEDLLVQTDGAIVVSIPDQNSGDSCLARYSATGQPDTSFGVGGVATIADLLVLTIAEQGTRFVVGGLTLGSSRNIRRLLSDGAPDNGFAAPPLDSGFISALDVDGDGAIVAVDSQPRVRRYLANGKADATFGTDGVAPSAFEAPGAVQFTARHVVVQRDGRIVIAVTTTTPGPPVSHSFVDLVRYDVDGALDESFSTDGIQGSAGEFVGGMALQPDGKIVLSSLTNGVPFLMTTGEYQIARHIGTTLTCPATAASGCHGGTVPLAAKLRMDAPTGYSKAKYQWKWQKGAATMVTDFGDPVGGDDYTLCVYDESSGSTLAAGATIPGGGTCKGKPCWKALGTSRFAYKDSNRLRYGIGSIKLKAGAAGKAQVAINGQGAKIPVPGLPAPLPLRVQILAENGQCWESVFSSSGTSRNDSGRYQGKSD